MAQTNLIPPPPPGPPPGSPSLNPLASYITISMQLEVKGNNKVQVPGLEPTSALSSRALGAYMAKQGFINPLVDLDEALAAIPGSYVKFMTNFQYGAYRKRFLVLPPAVQDCNGRFYPDYYAILKKLAKNDVPVEEKFDNCDINGMGYCPHPDFKMVEQAPPDPYQPEGSFPDQGGVLPPVPGWADFET